MSALVDSVTFEELSKLQVYDASGKEVSFTSIFANSKVVVVFIRHFFCGSCQMYVSGLSSISDDVLAGAGTELVVVGCGEWNPISAYAETTGFKGKIFADPSRRVYRALGMNIETLAATPSGQQRRSYLTRGALSNALLSIWKGPLKNPQLIGKQGNLSQLGGEFIFGPGNQCTFAHRMQHTEDHLLKMAEGKT